MGIFHIKKGTAASKAIPDKSNIKDGPSICLDFCCHDKKCKYPNQLCPIEKHYTTWKHVPDGDKLVILSHMDSTGLFWLDDETMKNHKNDIPLPNMPTYLVMLWDQNHSLKRVRNSAVVFSLA